MENTQPRRGRLVLSVIASLMIAMLGMLGFSSAAVAAPGPGQKGAPSSGTLTIHKYAGTPTGDEAHDGTELGSEPARQPLSGVEFTVTQVTSVNGKAVDLSDPTVWEAVKAYDASSTAGLILGDSTPISTDDDGIAEFAGLDLGVYLVQETDEGGHDIIDSVEPFLVTLPLPQGDGGWLYDVHVYPKNLIKGIAQKKVDDSMANANGDEVTWTVTSPALGAGTAGRPLTDYTMTDDLDNRLQFVEESVTVSIDGEPVSEAFYGVDHPGGLGGKLTISFTQEGLAHLNTRDADAVVTFAFDTQVYGIGVIPNDATILVGDGKVTDTYRTDKPTTPWGQVIISKTDVDNEDLKLQGATFEVYTNDEGAGDPIDVEVEGEGTVTEFTTGADGTVTIPGLKAGTYWLKETEAPAGYVLADGLFKVTVVAGETAEASTRTRDITNQQQDVPELPLTGASGQLLMVLGGAALLLIAAGLVLVKRRQAAQQ